LEFGASVGFIYKESEYSLWYYLQGTRHPAS